MIRKRKSQEKESSLSKKSLSHSGDDGERRETKCTG